MSTFDKLIAQIRGPKELYSYSGEASLEELRLKLLDVIAKSAFNNLRAYSNCCREDPAAVGSHRLNLALKFVFRVSLVLNTSFHSRCPIEHFSISSVTQFACMLTQTLSTLLFRQIRIKALANDCFNDGGNRDGPVVPVPGFGMTDDGPAGFITNLDLHIAGHVITAGSPGYAFHNTDSPARIDVLDSMSDNLAPPIQISFGITCEQLAQDPATLRIVGWHGPNSSHSRFSPIHPRSYRGGRQDGTGTLSGWSITRVQIVPVTAFASGPRTRTQVECFRALVLSYYEGSSNSLSVSIGMLSCFLVGRLLMAYSRSRAHCRHLGSAGRRDGSLGRPFVRLALR